MSSLGHNARRVLRLLVTNGPMRAIEIRAPLRLRAEVYDLAVAELRRKGLAVSVKRKWQATETGVAIADAEEDTDSDINA